MLHRVARFPLPGSRFLPSRLLLNRLYPLPEAISCPHLTLAAPLCLPPCLPPASFVLPTQYLAQTINPTLAPFSPLYTLYCFENPIRDFEAVGG